MTIENLFQDTGIFIPEQARALEPVKLQYDSRRIKSGDLFIAVKGYMSDGHHFLHKAQNAGAIAAVVEKKDPGLRIPQIIVNNTRQMMGNLAYNFYHYAFEAMSLIGITGTNGKTTTSFLVRSILNAAGIKTGLIGTIAYYYDDKSIEAWNTTPEAIDLAELIQNMHKANHQSCVLEVSSHALALDRVNAFPFRIGVFTNLSHDHLDFHKNIDNYFMAKAKLFLLLEKNGKAVVNYDDPYGAKLITDIKYPVITFGFDESADVRILDYRLSSNGMNLTIGMKGGDFKVHSELISLFNVQNILAAIATGLAMDVEIDAIQRGIAGLSYIPGRLEKYPIGIDSYAVIDYAHTPDALQKASEALIQIKKGRLIIVFGCGGERDRGKRSIMGKIAEELGNFVVITNDNPRKEDPGQIIDDILKGMNKQNKYIVIEDRKAAILYALNMAESGDIVLIAGKGHESYQILGGEKVEFNEPSIIKEAFTNA